MLEPGSRDERRSARSSRSVAAAQGGDPMNGVLDVAVFVLVALVLVALLRWALARPARPRKPTSAHGAGKGTTASRATSSAPAGCARHRWSPPRARLLLTGNGIRDAGQRIRFCLDCTAEKTDDGRRQEP